MRTMLGSVLAALMISSSTWAGGIITCDDIPTQTDLIAGKHYDAGDVIITTDDTYLYITIITQNGWSLTETHIAVGGSLADIPLNRPGCPMNGRFPYQSKHDNQTSHEVAIPLSSINYGETIVVAVHAVVVNQTSKGKRWEETAWGEGEQFRCGNWAMYIEHTPVECIW